MDKHTFLVKGYGRESGEKISRRVVARDKDDAIQSVDFIVESVSRLKPSGDGAGSIPDVHKRDDRNIKISLGFGADRSKRDYERPSRKLIYILIFAWAGVTVVSLLIGGGAGYSLYTEAAAEATKEAEQVKQQAQDDVKTYKRIAADAIARADAKVMENTAEADERVRIAEQQVEAIKQRADRTIAQANRDAERIAANANRRIAQANEAILRAAEAEKQASDSLNKASISTGTKAEVVSNYLGTPDKIETTNSDKVVYWHYGDVRIRLRDYSSEFDRMRNFEVRAWTGDLNTLLQSKLKP